MEDPIYHFALRDEWADALVSGTYRRSTVGRSLEEEGFIHCSFRSQLEAVADRFYMGRADVVLLQVEPGRVPAEIRVEKVGDDEFPHIYGELPVQAVVGAVELPLDGDGRLVIDRPLE